MSIVCILIRKQNVQVCFCLMKHINRPPIVEAHRHLIHIHRRHGVRQQALFSAAPVGPHFEVFGQRLLDMVKKWL